MKITGKSVLIDSAKTTPKQTYELVEDPLSGQLIAKPKGTSAPQLTLSLRGAAEALSSHVQLAMHKSTKPNASEVVMYAEAIAKLQVAFNSSPGSVGSTQVPGELIAELRNRLTP